MGRVWRAYAHGEPIGERKVTKNTERGYGAVLYDPISGQCALWSGSVENAQRERGYALRKGRTLDMTTDIRQEEG